MRTGLEGVPTTETPLAKGDFASPAEVRWCPGCGDHVILATMLGVFADLGIKKENVAVISGIGCSSRMPYYVDCYGFHSIHGRAPAIASGVAISRPDLSVWVMTGDGDSLSIGGNHLIHALRRNINLNILVFNNRIYGLTKGQASPTSETGKITKSTPAGLVDEPFNPVQLALGAGGSFVARTTDWSRAHLAETLAAAAAHRGTSFVEIYQNCTIFNDGAFDGLKGPDANLIQVKHGEPMLFGQDNSRGVIRGADGSLQVANVADVGLDRVLVHDAHASDPGVAFQLASLTDVGVTKQAPIGILRDVERPVFDDDLRSQLCAPSDPAERLSGLQSYISGRDIWTVE